MMQFKIGEKYNGFILSEEGELKELNSKWRVFLHEKSGAKLFHLENDDDNKVFTVSFRTPPKNSTGVAHILEHSVLCGSRKFPVKEPFVELLKGSMNTFLNAFTFADKTMYPVASRNKKDFFNLMDVYLDAVFHPNIYVYPEIMKQEGWHYELNSKEDELSYKGVVYNEMKGAFSSPESVLMRKVSESLFPDTTYGVESGGDPEHITDLSQEEFIKFHKTYYHPSNSYIYLYGDMDILEALGFIDDNYLKEYDKMQVDSEIGIQKSFDKQRRVEVEYPISQNEKEEDKTFFSLNYVISRSTEPEISLAFEILENLLLETPAAPLRKAIIEANLGRDVFGMFDNNILQPTFSVVVKNSNLDREEEFKKVVEETLIKLVNEGIDKKLIESAINLKEFHLRESDFNSYPKGLIYSIMCMDTWLYDQNPVLNLQYEETLKEIKKALTTDYFEKLIKKYILDNSHSSLLVVKPKKGLAEEKAAELQHKLSELKKSLTAEELDRIVKQTESLRERQTSGDSQEDIEKIPLLSLKDIKTEADKLPMEEKMENDTKVLFHNIFTNGICYVNLYFDTSCVRQELLPYISLLAEVLGNIGTESYGYEDLSNEININTGGIRFTAKAYMQFGTDEKYYPKLMVKAKSIKDKIPTMMELMAEIIKKSKFENKKRIRELIGEIKSRYEMKIYSEGNAIAAARVQGYFSPFGRYMEVISGISFYHFIVDLDKNFEEKYEEIVAALNEVSKASFNKRSLLISVTSSEEEYEGVKNNLSSLLTGLSEFADREKTYCFEMKAENEGLMTSGKVQYVAKGGNFIKLGYNYTGTLLLLRTAARFDYLWNRVRVQGGAYGCSAAFLKNGNMYFTSYRDPNLTETLKIYDEMHQYIESFNADEREMTKYVIGTISELDTPLSPAMKGQVSTANYICGIKQEDIQKERDQILKTDVDSIRKLSKLVGDVMKENYICVLGSEEKIKANDKLFENVINVME